jgi:hypothetical protein
MIAAMQNKEDIQAGMGPLARLIRKQKSPAAMAVVLHGYMNHTGQMRDLKKQEQIPAKQKNFMKYKSNGENYENESTISCWTPANDDLLGTDIIEGGDGNLLVSLGTDLRKSLRK